LARALGPRARTARLRLGHLLEQVALVVDVLAREVDQFREFLVALFQEDVDVAPGLVDVALEADDPVVQHRDVRQDPDYDEEPEKHSTTVTPGAILTG